MSANDTSPSLFPSLSAITELNSALAPPLPAVVAPAPSSIDDAYGPPPPASSSTLPPSVDYSTRAPSLQPSNHSNSNPSPVRTTQHPDDILQSQREGSETIFREKLIPTSKVYVGGLPEDTLHSDMEACFSKSGKILNIELKSGYGFVVRSLRAPSFLPVFSSPPSLPSLTSLACFVSVGVRAQVRS